MSATELAPLTPLRSPIVHIPPPRACGREIRGPRYYTEHYRLRHIARLRTCQALKKGTLVRPTTCPECDVGDVPWRKMHAHHPDYRKPLEIYWLCFTCHLRVHRGSFFAGGGKETRGWMNRS